MTSDEHSTDSLPASDSDKGDLSGDGESRVLAGVTSQPPASSVSNAPAAERRLPSIEIQMAMQQSFGPLPAPSHMLAYRQVIPGLDETLVEEWQAESKHRRLIQTRELDIRVTFDTKSFEHQDKLLAFNKVDQAARIRRRLWDQIIAAAALFAALAIATVLAVTGQGTAAATSVGFTGAAGIAWTLIHFAMNGRKRSTAPPSSANTH